MKRSRDFSVLSGLVILTTLASVWMAATDRAAWLEAFSFVSGAVCVWLTVKENVWNFPISLANVVAFGIVFARAQLYADAGLQAIYFVLTLIGWYLWLFGGEGRTELHIRRTPLRELLIVAVAGTAMTAALTVYLRRAGDALPFLDALTTSLSLCAQWLLNRKYLENWYFWVIVDVFYVPMYLYKSLYLTSFLYVVFLVMATMGLAEWLRRWQRQSLAIETAVFEEVA
jgi:nicotinamide mononucleotide transporter